MNIYEEGTICAISTAMSDAGIGIIRISGADAVSITDKIFIDGAGKHRLSSYRSHTINHGYITDPDNEERLDEVLVSVMRGPHSYTGEDVTEINCHGGRLVMQRVLELLLKCGCRMAEPGEFTKRAFLNGRMDLSEAQAVMDIISSENDFALKNAMKQLSGALSDDIREMRQIILHETARIEAALDDPDAYDLTDYPVKLTGILDDLTQRINRLIESWNEGRIRRDGIDTVILGRPNAGKSSFFNRMVGSDRAIVTEIPGTTRDLLEEKVRLGELTLNLIDTAGLRETDDTVERIGVERALKRAGEAELAILIIDASDIDTAPVGRLISEAEGTEGFADKRLLILLNKSDLINDTDHAVDMVCRTMAKDHEKLISDGRCLILSVSMLTGEGLEEVQRAIAEMFLRGELVPRGEYYLTDIRQRDALINARTSLTLVKESIGAGMSEDLFFTDLMDAYMALGLITGEQIADDLADEIFSSFCMGK